MTRNAKIVGGLFAVAMSFGAMAAPALAQTNKVPAHANCSIGETYNSGSIVDQDTKSSYSSTNANDPCYQVGR